jgi:membrane fusion protein, multidrug efflux system
MTTERRQRLWIFGSLGVLALALGGWAVFHKGDKPTPPPQAIPITATQAQSRDMTINISALGAAQAWTSDTIFAQVSGRLLKVNFTEGSEVRKGQVLALVDPAPYQAVLTQALGTLHRDEAILAGAERDLTRYQHLVATDSIARQTAEDEAATVAQDKGTVEYDRGVVAAARVNLRWCTIVSPVSGRAGVRLVDPGNLVSSSGSTASAQATASATSTASATASTSSGIVVINQLVPIAVTFTVPEGQFEHLGQLTDGFRKPLTVQAYSQESGQLLDSGQVTIADNKVDPATGTVELKARFENNAKHLWPGQFVNVKLASQMLPHATVIPTAAVNRGPKGTFAFVVGKDGKASVHPIQVLGTEGEFTAIKNGVNPGDTVVTDGQMILKAGSAVRITHPASQDAGS